MAFIDEAKFFVKAGDGGNGCVSFRREMFVPRGGPNGGDGGKGGDIIIVASKKLQSLIDFRYRSHFKADRGVHGQGRDMHGRGGADCYMEVPVGSILKDSETGRVIADLSTDGESIVIAKGGSGGLGNPHFKSGSNRTPRVATKGKLGEERWLRIELKLMADIGLVGLPNAGKSTLLSKLSAANPKIADYPFTTLEPQLGVLHFPIRNSCIIADIPGLVKDAHKGVGLGHKFLRHVERTRVLLHVIDGSAVSIMDDFNTIENELRSYKDELADREQLLVINKCDEFDFDPEYIPDFAKECDLNPERIVCISGITGEGLDRLIPVIESILDDMDYEAEKIQKAKEAEQLEAKEAREALKKAKLLGDSGE
ncbi:MAG: GTPase ObgE [Desulfotalea sp.]